MLRRHIHWLFLVLSLATLVFESLIWSSAVVLPDIGKSIDRSIRHEAPFAVAYAAAGDAMRPIATLRDYGDAYASEVFAPMHDEIMLAPEIASELAFGQTKNPRHGRMKMLFHAPLVLLALGVLAFVTRPRKVHMIPKRH